MYKDIYVTSKLRYFYHDTKRSMIMIIIRWWIVYVVCLIFLLVELYFLS
jgi:hypothetical protein